MQSQSARDARHRSRPRRLRRFRARRCSPATACRDPDEAEAKQNQRGRLWNYVFAIDADVLDDTSVLPAPFDASQHLYRAAARAGSGPIHEVQVREPVMLAKVLSQGLIVEEGGRG